MAAGPGTGWVRGGCRARYCVGEGRLQVQVLGGLGAATGPGTVWVRGGYRSRYWVAAGPGTVW